MHIHNLIFSSFAISLAVSYASAHTAEATSKPSVQNCDFGTAHANMPEQFRQYDFIIGDFDIRGHGWTGDGWTEGYRRSRWTGRYIVGGKAVMEEWYDFAPTDQPDTQGGVNVRMFDTDENIWKLMWMRTDKHIVTELRSELRDDGFMYLWRIAPTPDDRKVYFETLGPGRWTRYTYVKDENGEWVPKVKLDAYKRQCEN